jgi:hypothetical protein
MTLHHHSDDGDQIDEQALHDALTELARIELGASAPLRVEASVMRAWDAAHVVRGSSWRPALHWAGATALAASLLVACAISLLERPRTSIAEPLMSGPLDLSPPAAAAPPMVSSAVESSAEPLVRRPAGRRRAPDTPVPATPTAIVFVGGPVTAGEQVRIVRMRIARETLMSIGLRPLTWADDDTVDVDMLIGEDGVARGLRVGM